MVMLRPFPPLRYNTERIPDLSLVVAPPYDVISPAQRDALHERSDYNVVHLILNRAADPYATAAALLQNWREEGVLIRDRTPALSFYVEDFVLRDGSTRRREGIIGAVRLEAFESGQIRPHERTFARAKEDRMRILRACRTNLSPIFGLFADRAEVLDRARAAEAQRAPDLDLCDETGVRHRLWFITDPATIATIAGPLMIEPVVIADGHHRYETALAYRDACHAAGHTDPEAPHNFVLMYLTSMGHPGLVILPTHRVLAGVPGLATSDLLARLEPHFRLRAFARTARAEFWASLRRHRGSFGVAVSGGDQLVIATLENCSLLQRYAATLAPVVRDLDVTLLDTVVLRGLLGQDCTAAAQDGQLTYTHDDDAALDAVAAGAQVAFLMNPPCIEDVQSVCLAGETMPQKSTYFFPKLLTGLVFHPLNDDCGAAGASAELHGRARPADSSAQCGSK